MWDAARDRQCLGAGRGKLWRLSHSDQLSARSLALQSGLRGFRATNWCAAESGEVQMPSGTKTDTRCGGHRRQPDTPYFGNSRAGPRHEPALLTFLPGAPRPSHGRIRLVRRRDYADPPEPWLPPEAHRLRAKQGTPRACRHNRSVGISRSRRPPKRELRTNQYWR